MKSLQRLCLFVVIVAAMLACRAGLAQQQPRSAAAGNFSGIYVASNPLRTVKQNLPDSIYANGAADGVYLRLVWAAIEPQPGRFDFETLDREMDRALRAGKKVSIGVRTGFFAPEWLAAEGIPTSSFYVGRQGGMTGHCETMAIAWPWHEGYQRAYARMVQALADHLRKRPDAYAAVRIVKLTGINQRTEELRLPTGVEREGSCDRDAMTVWQQAGYTPSKVIAAWEALSGAVNAAFPDKVLAIEVLEANDFPGIDERGRIVRPASPDFVDVKRRVITAGLRMFPGRFAVQWDGLTASRVVPSVVWAGQQGAIVGWQTNQFRGFDGAGCNIGARTPRETCSASAYQAILDFGASNGGRYLEVWAPDAEQFPEALRAVRKRLN